MERDCTRLIDEAIATLESTGVIDTFDDRIYSTVDLEEILAKYRTGFEIDDLEENPALRHMTTDSHPESGGVHIPSTAELVSLDAYDITELGDGTALVIDREEGDE
ncbi:hypothetical protein N9E04_00390 [bacterium]|nr:hypothetical protein [bacterium]